MPFGYSYQLFGSDVPFALQRYGALVCEFVGGTTLWGLTSRTLSPFLRVFSQAQAIIRVTTALDLLTHSHDGDLFTLSCFNNFSLIQDNINRAVISSWLTVDLEGEKKKLYLHHILRIAFKETGLQRLLTKTILISSVALCGYHYKLIIFSAASLPEDWTS